MKTGIVITTTQTIHNEWMAFASWYSVSRTLPDHKVAVIFPRSNKSYHFAWLNRCHVPYLTYGYDITEQQAINNLINDAIIGQHRLMGELPVVILKDHMMIVREPDFSKVKGIVTAESLPCYANCSDEQPGDIVSYLRCGKFTIEEWIKKEKRPPFNRTTQLVSRNRTVNEQRVFQLWRQMDIFDFLNSSW